MVQTEFTVVHVVWAMVCLYVFATVVFMDEKMSLWFGITDTDSIFGFKRQTSNTI